MQEYRERDQRQSGYLHTDITNRAELESSKVLSPQNVSFMACIPLLLTTKEQPCVVCMAAAAAVKAPLLSPVDGRQCLCSVLLLFIHRFVNVCEMGGNFIFRLFEDSFNRNREIFLFPECFFHVPECFNRIKENKLFVPPAPSTHILCTVAIPTGTHTQSTERRRGIGLLSPQIDIQWSRSTSEYKWWAEEMWRKKKGLDWGSRDPLL